MFNLNTTCITITPIRSGTSFRTVRYFFPIFIADLLSLHPAPKSLPTSFSDCLCEGRPLAIPPPPFSNSPSTSSTPIFSIGLMSKILSLLSALFSTIVLPDCAPATAEAPESPTRPPARPAATVASVETVCFSVSLSSLTGLPYRCGTVLAFNLAAHVSATGTQQLVSVISFPGCTDTSQT